MNTSLPLRSGHKIKRLIWPMAVLGVSTLMVIGITGFFRLSRPAQCLRKSLTQSMNSESVICHKKIEFRVGGITCQIVRIVLSLAPLDDQASTALRAVRGAEVGIYEVNALSGPLEHAVMVSAADKSMAARGWDRLVGVNKERELLMVYVPRNPGAGSKLQACIAVIHDRQLVVVSARTDLEPLLELATRQPGNHGHVGSRLSRDPATQSELPRARDVPRSFNWSPNASS